MPTSITVAPGLTQSRRTISGLPTAANTRSARRQTAARSRVRECATVTVAFSASSSCTSGLPTMLERPITTASSPASESMHGLGQPHAAERRARRQRRQARRQAPGIDRMKAVDVLGRIDGGDHLLRVDLRRQRELHQDAVHGRIGVEPADQREQLGLGRGRRQPMIERPHAAADGHLHLAADIDLARRIVADQHDREPGRDAAVADQPVHRVGDLAAQVRRDRLAVDDVCRHVRPLTHAAEKHAPDLDPGWGPVFRIEHAQKSPVTALPDRADFLQRRRQRGAGAADLQPLEPRGCARDQTDIARRRRGAPWR